MTPKPGPDVSVIVPAFNGQDTIARTLQSVAGQRGPVPQIVVVDDGSTDHTVAAIADSGVAVTLLRQPNGGVCRARNAGAAAATGQYLCFIDQDDLWHPDHLRTQMAAFVCRPEAGVAVSPYRHWDLQHGHPENWDQAVDDVELDLRYCGWVFHEFMLDCWALTSATTIKRSVWDAWGGFDETREYGEDWDLWLRLSRQAPFVKVRAPSVLYHQHACQGSRKVRDQDHRTQLLLDNYARHGLSSRDGRRLDEALFKKVIAKYGMEFGCHHLAFGHQQLGQRALFQAWRRDPIQARYLALWSFSKLWPSLARSRLRRAG